MGIIVFVVTEIRTYYLQHIATCSSKNHRFNKGPMLVQTICAELKLKLLAFSNVYIGPIDDQNSRWATFSSKERLCQRPCMVVNNFFSGDVIKAHIKWNKISS